MPIKIHGGRDVENALLRYMNTKDPAFRAALLPIWEKHFSNFSEDDILLGVQTGTVSLAVVEAWRADLAEWTSGFWAKQIALTFRRIGVPMAKKIATFTSTNFSFDARWRWISDYFSTEAGKLTTNLTTTQTKAMEAVFRLYADRQDLSARQLSQLIKRSGIGPTVRDAKYIANVQLKMLEDKIPLQRIIERSDILYNRKVGQRAHMIARNELAKGWGKAQRETFREAVRAQVFPSDKVPARRWLTALARVCQICEPKEGEMVLWNQPFSVGEPGEIHVACRCTEEEVLLTASEAQDLGQFKRKYTGVCACACQEAA